jgi:putative heme iron utilization protein
MMPYAADVQGRPAFFISSMAVHSQNLMEDPRSSLLIMQPDVTGDPLGAGRVTILGTTTHATLEQVRDLYLSRHENAKFWQDYSDFAFYRLEVSAVYFIGGFGVMGWISAEDYTTAKPDPLAEAAVGIIEHMNTDHAAVRHIARHYAGEVPDEAAMTAVDRLGFHLRLKTGDTIYGRRIAFIREVASTEDAWSVLVEMAGHARTS